MNKVRELYPIWPNLLEFSSPTCWADVGEGSCIVPSLPSRRLLVATVPGRKAHRPVNQVEHLDEYEKTRHFTKNNYILFSFLTRNMMGKITKKTSSTWVVKYLWLSEKYVMLFTELLLKMTLHYWTKVKGNISWDFIYFNKKW